MIIECYLITFVKIVSLKCRLIDKLIPVIRPYRFNYSVTRHAHVHKPKNLYTI